MVSRGEVIRKRPGLGLVVIICLATLAGACSGSELSATSAATSLEPDQTKTTTTQALVESTTEATTTSAAVAAADVLPLPDHAAAEVTLDVAAAAADVS